MSGIKHQWNGSILTVVSDSGASSADLKGPKGDTGPRGPQGPGGVIYDESGDIVVDLSEYYSKTEVDNKIANVEVDLSDYATKAYVFEEVNNQVGESTANFITEKELRDITEGAGNLASKDYVTTEIAKAQLAEVAGDVDLSGFATKDDLNNVSVAVDGKTIITQGGVLRTAIGGYTKLPNEGYLFNGLRLNIIPDGRTYFDAEPLSAPIEKNKIYGYRIISDNYNFQGTFIIDDYYAVTLAGAFFFQYIIASQSFQLKFYTNADPLPGNLYEFALWEGEQVPDTIVPIDAKFIPVDGTTITINDKGQLTVIGGTDLSSSEEVEY